MLYPEPDRAALKVDIMLNLLGKSNGHIHKKTPPSAVRLSTVRVWHRTHRVGAKIWVKSHSASARLSLLYLQPPASQLVSQSVSWPIVRYYKPKLKAIHTNTLLSETCSRHPFLLLVNQWMVAASLYLYLSQNTAGAVNSTYVTV